MQPGFGKDLPAVLSKRRFQPVPRFALRSLRLKAAAGLPLCSSRVL